MLTVCLISTVTDNTKCFRQVYLNCIYSFNAFCVAFWRILETIGSTEIGRKLSGRLQHPFLKIGVISTIFQLEGNFLLLTERFTILHERFRFDACSSILIADSGAKNRYFFLKCILKKTNKKQNCFLFKPVLIFLTIKYIKKQAAELFNISSLLPLLYLLLLLFISFLAPFVFSNTHLKREKSVLASSISILLMFLNRL